MILGPFWTHARPAALRNGRNWKYRICILEIRRGIQCLLAKSQPTSAVEEDEASSMTLTCKRVGCTSDTTLSRQRDPTNLGGRQSKRTGSVRCNTLPSLLLVSRIQKSPKMERGGSEQFL